MIVHNAGTFKYRGGTLRLTNISHSITLSGEEVTCIELPQFFYILYIGYIDYIVI